MTIVQAKLERALMYVAPEYDETELRNYYRTAADYFVEIVIQKYGSYEVIWFKCIMEI